jgi:zinc D-Ala-D-Ala carboxypeptidase
LLDKADPPEDKPRNFSPADDIPEAFRDTPVTKPDSKLKPIWLVGGLAGLAVVGLSIVLSTSVFNSKSANVSTPDVASTNPNSSGSETSTPATQDNVLGHLPYQEAPRSELKAVTADGRIKLHQAAARKFKAMTAAARSQGVNIVLISGFRSVKDQNRLFFEVKAQRNQEASQRAEVSAPPGYSEHHTGYAVDIGDGRAPGANLKPSFENTKAFKWMRENAPRYQFELSFPKDNPQGVSYEPWHWRFVGDRESLETFYRAKNLK